MAGTISYELPKSLPARQKALGWFALLIAVFTLLAAGMIAGYVGRIAYDAHARLVDLPAEIARRQAALTTNAAAIKTLQSQSLAQLRAQVAAMSPSQGFAGLSATETDEVIDVVTHHGKAPLNPAQRKTLVEQLQASPQSLVDPSLPRMGHPGASGGPYQWISRRDNPSGEVMVYVYCMTIAGMRQQSAIHLPGDGSYWLGRVNNSPQTMLQYQIAQLMRQAPPSTTLNWPPPNYAENLAQMRYVTGSITLCGVANFILGVVLLVAAIKTLRQRAYWNQWLIGYAWAQISFAGAAGLLWYGLFRSPNFSPTTTMVSLLLGCCGVALIFPCAVLALTPRGSAA